MLDVGPASNGLGLFQSGFPHAEKGFGHGGRLPGYVSTMVVVPSSGDIIVVLISYGRVSPNTIAEEIATALDSSR